MGKKVVEIRPQGVNKGAVTRTILKMHAGIDFVLCIGDDTTDEDMFNALKESKDLKQGETPVKCFTCTVSQHESAAGCYIGSQVGVVKLLKSLAGVRT